MFKVLKNVFKKIRSEEESPEDALKAIDADKGRTLKEKYIEDVLWELEIALYEADVAQDVVIDIRESLKKDLVGKKVQRGHDREKAIEGSLRKTIMEILKADYFDLARVVNDAEKPYVIMFVGVNGSGKTTTIARIAHLLKIKGYTSVMAAGDTFRAGAIEQLSIHGRNLGINVIKHTAGADPAAVAFDAVEHAKARKKDVVLIDTAGRMQTNANLMDQLKKMKRVSKPDLIIFVGDALAGNDAVEQAVKFNEAVDVDSAILTKIDADAKGGAALSISKMINAPIIFVGVGQEYEDLEYFSPEWMTKRLFENST